jgi:hypothetical protein
MQLGMTRFLDSGAAEWPVGVSWEFHGQGVSWTEFHGVSWTEFHGQTEVALYKLRLSCHFYLAPFGLKVKNFHRPTGCIHITKDIDKMARMGDIASAASD